MERIGALLVIVGLLVLSIVGYALTYNDQTQSSCPIPPGFGNFNAGLLHLERTSVSGKVRETISITGTLIGKNYTVNGRGCPYHGRVTIVAYEGPALNGPWNLIDPNLTAPGNVEVEVFPEEFYLSPGGKESITVTITPRKAGTFHVYIVAFSDEGWKAWAELTVTAG